jgi:hypothetical protein
MNNPIFFILPIFCLLCICRTALANECVILLHGLARTEKSMNKMADALTEEGYSVVNFSYPSRKHTIETLAERYIPQALARCGEHETVSFVTHSLGGIVLRQYQQTREIEHLHRVVMLGPPNRGSQVVDAMRDVPGFKLLNGPAGLQLGTGPDSVPLALGPAQGEVGVIAGSRSINLILSLYLPNPDDGKVSVENTKFDGIADHMIVHVSHPFLMKDKEVIRQTIYFLANGGFDHNAA